MLAALHAGVIPAGAGDGPTPAPPPKCEAFSCDDPMFTVEYPHNASFVTRSGIKIPLPVDYYDGSAGLLFGPASLERESQLLAGTPYEPVRTTDGYGIAVLDIANYGDTDLGAYNEAMLAFVVHTGDTDPVADDPGAMIATALDPNNSLWIVRLILDNQLGIDAGREYLGVPKEPQVMSMRHDVSTAGINVADAEPDGTPILSMQVPVDAGSTAAVGLAGQSRSLAAIGKTALARGGNVYLRGAFSDVRHPSAVGYMQGVFHSSNPASLTIASVGAEAPFSPNPATQFGADITRLAFRPGVAVVVSGMRIAIDLSL